MYIYVLFSLSLSLLHCSLTHYTQKSPIARAAMTRTRTPPAPKMNRAAVRTANQISRGRAGYTSSTCLPNSCQVHLRLQPQLHKAHLRVHLRLHLPLRVYRQPQQHPADLLLLHPQHLLPRPLLLRRHYLSLHQRLLLPLLPLPLSLPQSPRLLGHLSAEPRLLPRQDLLSLPLRPLNRLLLSRAPLPMPFPLSRVYAQVQIQVHLARLWVDLYGHLQVYPCVHSRLAALTTLLRQRLQPKRLELMRKTERRRRRNGNRVFRRVE